MDAAASAHGLNNNSNWRSSSSSSCNSTSCTSSSSSSAGVGGGGGGGGSSSGSIMAAAAVAAKTEEIPLPEAAAGGTPTTTTRPGSGSGSATLTTATKPRKKRSRASKKPMTTLVRTDPTNFRAMVQQFTGAPPSMLPPPPPPPVHPHHHQFDSFSALSALGLSPAAAAFGAHPQQHSAFPFDVGSNAAAVAGTAGLLPPHPHFASLQAALRLKAQNQGAPGGSQGRRTPPHFPVYSQI